MADAQRQSKTQGVLHFSGEDGAVGIPESQRPISVDDAVALLKRDPSQPVRVRIADLDVELRVVAAAVAPHIGLGELMAAAGPWEGETTEELIRILREGRDAGGTVEPPESL